MKAFWTWLQNLLVWNEETSKEFNTTDYQKVIEEAHYENVVKYHHPVYSKAKDRAS